MLDSAPIEVIVDLRLLGETEQMRTAGMEQGVQGVGTYFCEGNIDGLKRSLAHAGPGQRLCVV